ncbi:RNase adapter RapZ [Mesosutterella sp. AGMB02718]|uniref:RNase adapter RapZ n=1 Tax=Mesosutterella faecium TaxID=2925194 RepID=A0ABT7INM9_9BURK|nr:RNase adapter RapZ [Mesosutterella sp. AGMB02718]MDL2058926.1 RNase adapter RapZ [Mesosutterella sp. AGMB02718]
MQVIVVTGLSGSGKSVAIKQLEDSGFYCIDNLPVDFIVPVAKALDSSGQRHIAISVDVRTHAAPQKAKEKLSELRHLGYDVKVLALTASTPAIVQRYSETRRRHPLTPLNRRPGDQTGLQEAIAKERAQMDLQVGEVLDTTDLSPSTLRAWIRQFINAPASEMTLSFESFAFKKGIPVAADLVFDARCLANPYYEPGLRELTGKDAPVIEFLEKKTDALKFVGHIEEFIRTWLPAYMSQDRHYLTVCIGCTGGQHRSVYVAEALFRRFARTPGAVVRHRALDNKTPQG